MQALLVDLYELTMGESYVAQGIDERPATFQLFCRNLPPGWGYLVAAGIEDALAFLDELRFGDEELAFLEETGLFSAASSTAWRDCASRVEVRAMREGTVFFPNEPVLEVTGPLLEAQLVETALVNVVHFQSLIAARAARCVDVAAGAGWSSSACAALTVGRRASRWHGRATSPASTPRATCSPDSVTASRSPERWPTPTSNASPARSTPSGRSRSHIRMEARF